MRPRGRSRTRRGSAAAAPRRAAPPAGRGAGRARSKRCRRRGGRRRARCRRRLGPGPPGSGRGRQLPTSRVPRPSSGPAARARGSRGRLRARAHTLPPVSRPQSCSAFSLALGEPLRATAPEASSWLLVEQPGPWGRDALDLGALARGERPGVGATVERPLYLVCTNSRRDACCARLGRPLVAALAETYPGRVWECSHLGGHRFAPNLVCLPDGLWFGRSEAAVAAEYERGRVALEHLRGRSSFPAAVQAADYFVREREGLRDVDDLALEGCAGDEGTLRGTGGRRFHVRLRQDLADSPRPLSCGDEKHDRPVVWSLVEMAS